MTNWPHSHDAPGTETPESRAAERDMTLHEAHDTLEVETLRPVVLDEASELASKIALIWRLHHDRVRRLGFMSPDDREREDKLIRQEKADRVQHARDRIIPPGYTAAPGSVAVHSAMAEIHASLGVLDWHAQQQEATWPLCLHPRRPNMPTTLQLLARVALHAIYTSNAGWLNDASEALASLNRVAARIADGPDMKRLEYPCPYCNRRTLVWQVDEGVIACDKDPVTGEHEPCTCWDPLCECKTRPRSHRHRWIRSKGGFPKLAGLINHAKEATTA